MTKNITIENDHILMVENLRLYPGKALPLGASFRKTGLQFSIFSRHATTVWLQLYDKPTDVQPRFEIQLSPTYNKTGDYWHITVDGLQAGQLYLYRINGPFKPLDGLRFNPHKTLLDPYARAVTTHTATAGIRWNPADALSYRLDHPDKDLSLSDKANAGSMPKCIVIDNDFDWQGDRPLNYPLHTTIIYETHLRGLSMHPSARRFGVKNPGTFRAITEMIPYLQDLGITSLELLPIQEFDEGEYSYRNNPISGEALTNYWGYSTIAFFAPKASYGTLANNQVAEFKEMVRQLHSAGIEIILDIVFNHSAEGGQLGPTYSFRGIDNGIYYLLADDPRFYRNYSGCGNTLNCNHPVVKKLIIDVLQYWVQDMHVDGFRFDLASALGRDENGELMERPPLLEYIADDPLLRNTKIIAEAWDAAGAYQVGSFPGGRWAEWNDRYRDDVKMFWRGDRHSLPAFATRLIGSADLYLTSARKPSHSINYVTAHDGFTLNDLVSYNEKHNENNGEQNHDGHNYEFSYNYGHEGDTDDAQIAAIRNRMVKNFMATLLLSNGTPMILGGDEIRRSQQGNNNAYCQDNEVSWHNYDFFDQHSDIFRFLRCMIHFRREQSQFRPQEFFPEQNHCLSCSPNISWFNAQGKEVNWDSTDNLLALKIAGNSHSTEASNDLLIFFNATTTDCSYALPSPQREQRWYRIVDTAQPSPKDFLEPGSEALVPANAPYLLTSRSLAVFISRNFENFSAY